MAKLLIIKGADFSANAVAKVTPTLNRNYIYKIGDEVFNAETKTWDVSAFGFGLQSNSELVGKTLCGVRMRVATPGTCNLYKASSPSLSTPSEFVKLTSFSTSESGVQDIPFDTPITLANGDYLIIGKVGDGSTLEGMYGAESDVTQKFYVKVGTSGVFLSTTKSLDLDFYTLD